MPKDNPQRNNGAQEKSEPVLFPEEEDEDEDEDEDEEDDEADSKISLCCGPFEGPTR
jgi:hypothetical protein